MDNLSIYYIILNSLFFFAACSFIALIFLSAPYGRHIRAGWGPTLPPKLAWFIMELPAVVVIFYFFISGTNPKNIVLILFIAVWQIHYLHRAFVYPFLIISTKPFPILLIIFAMTFNSMNGYVNGYYLFSIANHYNIAWLQDSRCIFGVILFLIGFFINIHSDYILRELKKSKQGEYQIPNKGLFRYVANPNYLGEIMEWGGWTILTWSLPALAFLLFTIANLLPRAYSNHKWYKANFKDYPQERKALIPFIF